MEKEKDIRQIEHMYEYKVGGEIQGHIIKKIYFYDDEKKYIIIKDEQGQIRVFGQHVDKISPLLVECNNLIDIVHNKRLKKLIEYEKALAINQSLLGQQEESEIILKKAIEKIKASEIVRKKIYYIGIYLIITILMVILTFVCDNLNLLGERYLQLLRVAMFGSLGGFVSLNIHLEKVKFEIAENTRCYIIVSIYKLVFAMVSSVISCFFIESDLLLSVVKQGSENYIYLEYVLAALAGFSENLLPNVFSNFEKEILDDKIDMND